MKIRQVIILILSAYIIPWAYTLLSQFWALHGGTSSTLNSFEFPLIIVLSIILYFNPETNRSISKYSFTPAISILGLYVLYDIVYSYFGRSPRLSDCQNIMALYSVNPLMFFSFLGILLAISAPILLSFLFWASHVSSRKMYTILSIKIFTLFVLSIILFSDQTYSYQKRHLCFTVWTDNENVRKNGRINSFLYYHNKRKDSLTYLENHKYIAISDHFYRKKPNHKRNIHIVILESFVDPRKIKNITFNQSPVSKNLTPFLLNQTNFSMVESPVYGGGTPQAEFEVLTGIPALALIESIEFNLFEGSPTSSLVNMLKEIGYHTIASVGTKPVFYNSRSAYKGIGFDEIHFLEKSSYFKKSPDDFHIFDGDLLEANISHIKKHLTQNQESRPLLNYVIGMYGHIPFDRNKKNRPDVLSANSVESQITDLSNQFYYRTEALAKFIEKLFHLDPDSIILVLGDHLPPIFNNKKIVYSHGLKTNIALLLNNFTSIDISGKKHYEISHVLWNLLNESDTPQNTKDLFVDLSEEEVYYSYIMEAMGLRTPAKIIPAIAMESIGVRPQKSL